MGPSSPGKGQKHPSLVTEPCRESRVRIRYFFPDLGDGYGVWFLLRVLASGGCESLQFIPTDDSLPLHDVPTRWLRTPPMTPGSYLSRAMSVGVP